MPERLPGFSWTKRRLSGDRAVAWFRLCVAAWVAFAVHQVAGVAMATVLRHGLDANPDVVARLRFLVDHRVLWVGAWLTWNAAALTILYFYAMLAGVHRLDGRSPVGVLQVAVMVTIAAVAADLAAEAVEMGVLPELAKSAVQGVRTVSLSSWAIHVFLTLHRVAVMLTGYLANGLYTVAALLLVVATRHAYPVWVWAAGLLVGVAGAALSAAALLNSVEGMVWTTIVLLPSLLTWQAGVAMTAATRSRGALEGGDGSP